MAAGSAAITQPNVQLQQWSEELDIWLHTNEIGPKPIMIAVLKAHAEMYPETGWRLRKCLLQ